jgi:multimeric flavodoxin WrbA
MTSLRALSLNCTLKPSPADSSTDVLLDQVTEAFAEHAVESSRLRIADLSIAPGVTADEGDGDDWPSVRDAILDADILVFGTPIWLGHPSSFAQRVLERLDAFLGDTDEREQMRTVDRVACLAVVGNEDGAHHVGAELFQGLNDVGFTIAPGAMTYWVGEAMQGTDYQDLDEVPDKVAQTTKTMVTNTVHLAEIVHRERFPSLAT